MSDRRVIMIAAVMPLVLFGVLFAFGNLPVLDGVLADSDCYVRLMRVARLVETGDWYDGFEPLLNAPDGLVMHWTRPFDVLMLAGTVPGLVVTDFEQALFWWGVIISPVFAALTLGVLAWGALTVLPRWGVLVMAVLFLAQPGIYAVFQLGRPDHHSLLLFLAAAVLALLLRWLCESNRLTYPAIAGVAVALSLWVGTEALLLLFIVAAGLGLLWLLGRVDAALALWRFMVVFAVGVVVALAIERPPGDWTVVELDRLSSVHAVLAFAMLAAAGLVVGASRRVPEAGLFLRAAVACGAVLIPGLIMTIGFPSFFEGPYGQVAPEVREVFLAHVREAEPLFLQRGETWPNVVFTLGPICFVLPFTLWRTCRGVRNERDAYLILTLALVVYVAGTIHQVRLLGYAATVMVWLWAAVIVALVGSMHRLGPSPWRLLICVAGILALLIGHFVVAALIRTPESRRADLNHEGKCNWREAADYVRSAEITGTILTYIYPGPELAWRTGHGVFAAPYHRNQDGIVDAHRAFLAQLDQVRDILERREVGLVVLCLLEQGPGGHIWYVEHGGPESLYGRLASGRYPDWVSRVGAADPRLKEFLVFAVQSQLQLSD